MLRRPKTRLHDWSSDYAPISPPQLQGILRRRHTSTIADYASQYAGRHLVVGREAAQSTYRQHDQLTQSKAKYETTDEIMRTVDDSSSCYGDRKTVVRFSTDINNLDNRVSQNRMLNSNMASSKRKSRSATRLAESRTASNVPMTARSHSASDVQLHNNIQSTVQQNTQQYLTSAIVGQCGDNRDGGFREVQQRHRHRKWSSFLTKFTAPRKKSTKYRTDGLNKFTDNEHRTQGITERPFAHVVDQKPPHNETTRQGRRQLWNDFDQLDIRRVGRREASFDSDFARYRQQPNGDNYQDANQLQQPQMVRSSSEYQVVRRTEPKAIELYIDSDRRSSSDDSCSYYGYERIVDCKPERITTAKKGHGAVTDNDALATKPSVTAISNGEYALSSAAVACDSNARKQGPGGYLSSDDRRLVRPHHSVVCDLLPAAATTGLKGYDPQTGYLLTSQAMVNQSTPQRAGKDDSEVGTVERPPMSHYSEKTSKSSHSAATLSPGQDADELLLSSHRKYQSGVRRSESDYDVSKLKQRLMTSDLRVSPRVVNTPSTFHPKLSRDLSADVRAELSSLRLNDNGNTSPTSNGRRRFERQDGSRCQEIAVSSSRDDPCESVVGVVPPDITRSDDGNYDNLPCDDAASWSRGDNHNGDPPPASSKPSAPGMCSIPTIVIDPVPSERSHVTAAAAQNSGRDYVALYAWSPESESVRLSPSLSSVLPPVRTTSRRVHNSSGVDRRASSLTRTRTTSFVDSQPASRPQRLSLQPTYSRPEAATTPIGIPASPHYDCTYVNCVTQNYVTDQDVARIEMFYSSHKTEVFVCACVARIFRSVVMTAQEEAKELSWYPTGVVGVPVIVIDSGENKCRARKLYVLLADIWSGCSLWRDVIDHLSDYRVLSGLFHSMKTSRDHTRHIGLLFANSNDAGKFHHKLHNSTSGPTGDQLLSLSNETGDKRSRRKVNSRQISFRRKNAVKNLRKSDISAPCCFEHVSTCSRMPAFLSSSSLKKSQSDNCVKSGCFL